MDLFVWHFYNSYTAVIWRWIFLEDLEKYETEVYSTSDVAALFSITAITIRLGVVQIFLLSNWYANLWPFAYKFDFSLRCLLHGIVRFSLTKRIQRSTGWVPATSVLPLGSGCNSHFCKGHFENKSYRKTRRTKIWTNEHLKWEQRQQRIIKQRWQ